MNRKIKAILSLSAISTLGGVTENQLRDKFEELKKGN